MPDQSSLDRLKFDPLLGDEFFRYVEEKKEDIPEVAFPLPQSAAELQKFMASENGKLYKNGVANLIKRLKDWATQHMLPPAENYQAFLNQFNSYEGLNIKRNEDLFPFYSEGIIALNNIVHKIEAKECPINAETVIKNLVGELGKTCLEGLYTKMSLANLELSNDPAVELMSIRATSAYNVANELLITIKQDYTELEIHEGMEVHFIVSALNHYHEALGIKKHEDHYTESDEYTEEVIARMREEFPSYLYQKMGAEAAINGIIMKLDLSQLESKESGQYAIELKARLDMFGNDPLFNITHLYDEKAMENGKIKLASNAQDVIAITLLQRLNSTGYLNISPLEKVENKNNTLYIHPQHHAELSYGVAPTLYQAGKTLEPIATYCLHQCAKGDAFAYNSLGDMQEPVRNQMLSMLGKQAPLDENDEDEKKELITERRAILAAINFPGHITDQESLAKFFEYYPAAEWSKYFDSEKLDDYIESMKLGFDWLAIINDPQRKELMEYLSEEQKNTLYANTCETNRTDTIWDIPASNRSWYIEELYARDGGLKKEIVKVPVMLQSAVGNNDLNVVKTLIKLNVDVNLPPDYQTNEPIYIAAAQGRTEIFKALLATNKVNISRHNNIFHTNALNIAAMNNQYEIIKAAADFQVDLNVADRWARVTPLLAAACHGNGRCLQALADANVDLHALNLPFPDAMHNYEGYPARMTPLVYAALHGYADVIKVAIDNNIDVNVPTSAGVTPLAASLDGPDPIKVIKALLGSPKLLVPDEFIFKMAKEGKFDGLAAIAAAGIDINRINSQGQSLVMGAIVGGNKAIIEIACVNNVDLNRFNSNLNSTPLNLAFAFSQVDIANLLIANPKVVLTVDAEKLSQFIDSNKLDLAWLANFNEERRTELMKSISQDQLDKMARYSQSPLDRVWEIPENNRAFYLGELKKRNVDLTGLIDQAVVRDNGDVIRILRQLNVDLSVKNANDADALQKEPIFHAVMHGKAKAFTALCETKQADIIKLVTSRVDEQLPKPRTGEDLNHPAVAVNMMTPLLVYAAKEHANIIQAAVDLRLDVTQASFTGRTPLIMAAIEEKSDIISTLAKAGVNLDALNQPAGTIIIHADGSIAKNDNDTIAYSDYTPLMLATRKGHYDVIAAAAAANVNINVSDPYLSRGISSPLLLCMGQPEKLLESLIKYKVDLKILHQLFQPYLNDNYEIPLVAPAKIGNNYLNFFKKLLLHGVDMNIQNPKGQTVLFNALEGRQTMLVDLLLSHPTIKLDSIKPNNLQSYVDALNLDIQWLTQFAEPRRNELAHMLGKEQLQKMQHRTPIETVWEVPDIYRDNYFKKLHVMGIDIKGEFAEGKKLATEATARKDDKLLALLDKWQLVEEKPKPVSVTSHSLFHHSSSQSSSSTEREEPKGPQ